MPVALSHWRLSGKTSFTDRQEAGRFVFLPMCCRTDPSMTLMPQAPFSCCRGKATTDESQDASRERSIIMGEMSVKTDRERRGHGHHVHVYIMRPS